MFRDIKELREMGYSDAEIAKIMGDGDETITEGIAEEIARTNVEESEDDEDKSEDDEDDEKKGA